jgi:hypothetical protein
MNCTNHPETAAVVVCAQCGRPLCESCTIHWMEKVTCKHCLETGALAKREQTPHLRKSPFLAGLLSVLPGAGQVYVGYYASGFINILVVCGLITLLARKAMVHWEPFLGTFLSFFWIFNIIDAVRRARLYNEYLAGERPERLPTDSPLIAGVLLLVLGLLLTLEITFGISLDAVEMLWPLAVLAGGIYLVWKYVRTRRGLSQVRTAEERSPSGEA